MTCYLIFDALHSLSRLCLARGNAVISCPYGELIKAFAHTITAKRILTELF